MMYIIGVHEENGAMVEFKQIYSLERPDIEQQFSKEVFVHAIKNGREKMTAYWKWIDGKAQLVEGEQVIVTKNDELRTIANGRISDNLGSLAKY